jgi:hypothetical protein
MTDTPYVRLHGLEITDDTPANRVIVRDSLNISGGGRKVEGNSCPGIEYAAVTENGREMVKFTFQVWSKTRADIERVRMEANNCPVGAEFQPFNSSQILYVSKASASIAKPKAYIDGWGYYSDIEVYCRDSFFLGEFQGIPYSLDVSLPQTVSLTNNGNYESGLDYLLASGGYDALLGYTDDFAFAIDDVELRLCDQLLRGDVFRVSSVGDVLHSYETEFPRTYAGMQADLHGSSYVDYGTGGSIAYQSFVMANSAKFMMTFKGPLPVKDRPYLEIECTAVIGSPRVSYAVEADLSDIEDLDVDLEVGVNKIYLPSLEGEDDVYIGVTTNASSSLTLSRIYAQVPRYISSDEMPKISPLDAFVLKISDGESSNHLLDCLYASYRDKE